MAYKNHESTAKKDTRFVSLSLVISFILSVMAAVSYFTGVSNIFEGIASTAVYPLTKLGSVLSGSAEKVTSHFGDIAALKEENRRLKAENAELARSLEKSRTVYDENEKLYAFLNLKREFSDLSLVNAGILARESGSFMTDFTIDKGTAHGVHKDMPILCSDSVIGVVMEEGLTSSRAVSLVDYRSGIGVYVLRTGMPAVLRGDFSLAQDGKCIISGLAPETDISEGDLIYTSGLGEVFPKDIYVGSVCEVRKDSNTYTLSAIVKPQADLVNTDLVMVVTSFEKRYEAVTE